MKNVAKTISILMSTLLVLSLSACGDAYRSGNITDPEETTDIRGSVNMSPATDESTYPAQSPNDTNTVNESSTPDEGSYTMGSTRGGTYTNDFLKIGCSLDENWTYYNEEQLAELSGVALDAIGNEALSQTLSESMDTGTIVYDMFASSTDGLVTINIIFEKLGVLHGLTMDEDTYIDSSLDTLQEALESAGFTNVTLEKASVDLAGSPRSAIAVTGEYLDLPVYEEIVCIKRGNYMATISLCSITDDITDYLAGLFYSID